MGNIIIQVETWMEPDPGERGSDGMEVDSTKRLQGRMTNVQWDLKYCHECWPGEVWEKVIGPVMTQTAWQSDKA